MDTTFDPGTTDIFLFTRAEMCLVEGPVCQSLGDKRAAGLIFADPRAPELDLQPDGTVAFFKACLRRLRNGGSIAVPCDFRALTSLSRALEAAGFKQLRFVQAVSRTLERDFYPENSRTMMIMAVRGGGSTFNSIYNNGHYPRPEESNKGTPLLPATTCPQSFLLSEIVSVHSNPGDVVATTSSPISEKLAGFLSPGSIVYRQRPPLPDREEKAAAGQAA